MRRLTTIAMVGMGLALHAEWTMAQDALVITPTSGTMFDNSLTVAMTGSVGGAVIHDTLDGKDPTIDSPIYKKFKISGKTTVKAAPFSDDGSHGDVVTASYALGQCADPVVSLADGTVFRHSGQEVSIERDGEEGVLRYTLDGTDPTSESESYASPFTVSNSVVVKAKVFSDRYFDSAVVTVNLTREWEAVATPVITAAEEFTGSGTEVEIVCATPGATIRYSVDGSEPTLKSPKYTKPFRVDKSCTIRAVATCEDYLTSAVVTSAVTKVWCIGDTMGAPDQLFATSGDAGFVRVVAKEGESMRSGTIGNSAVYGCYTRSVLSSTVNGPGTLSFKWRSSCERDDGYEWDHAEFAVDGVVVERINGVTEWMDVKRVIAGSGDHVVTWTYLKDDSEGAGDDCLWVAGFSWTANEPRARKSRGRSRRDMAKAGTNDVYCVIDISGGSSAEHYPVSYRESVPEGGWDDGYKTTNIVLRRVDAGTYPVLGNRRVTFTKPFYIGIFELTQKQIKLLSGDKNRKFVFEGDMRPADCLTWDEMRGKNERFDYPKTKEVAPDSIIGKLRAKTGLSQIDLPTSYQFGCAWDAGTDGRVSDARSTGRHFSNQHDGRGGYGPKHAIVGSYRPNEWGIYDLHGNVWEMCVDRLGNQKAENENDPVGPMAGAKRQLRGGCWDSADGSIFSSFVPQDKESSDQSGKTGCRIVINVEADRVDAPALKMSVAAKKLQSCDFLLNKDFKKSAKYYLCLFSASWCPPCRAEMPRIAKAYAETLKDDPDIELIHFSCDRDESKALAWAREHDVKFPVVKSRGGNPLDLHTRGIPHLFIVKADGTLVEEGYPMKLFTEEKLRELKSVDGGYNRHGITMHR